MKTEDRMPKAFIRSGYVSKNLLSWSFLLTYTEMIKLMAFCLLFHSFILQKLLISENRYFINHLENEVIKPNQQPAPLYYPTVYTSL